MTYKQVNISQFFDLNLVETKVSLETQIVSDTITNYVCLHTSPGCLGNLGGLALGTLLTRPREHVSGLR
jgi:hypothetical protein